MNAELLMQVKALDPAPVDAELPTGMAPAHVVLAAIDERSRTVQTKERVQVQRPEPRRLRAALVAAAAFVAVLAIGVMIWLIGSGDELPVVTEPSSTTTQATTTTQASPPTNDTSATSPPSGFGSLEQGTYRLDTFDTPFTFTVDVSVFFVQENRGGFFAVSPPDSRDPDDRDMVIVQLSALSDPAAPNASRGDQAEWPANDFGGWLDNLTDGVIVTDRAETTLGGLDAVRADLELGDIECLAGNPYCVLLDRAGSKSLNPGVKYRIWVVDQGTGRSLAVVLAITNEADRAWLDAYEKVLSTLAFEDPAAG